MILYIFITITIGKRRKGDREKVCSLKKIVQHYIRNFCLISVNLTHTLRKIKFRCIEKLSVNLLH